eukprot:3936522-Rhodomonas_salina.1
MHPHENEPPIKPIYLYTYNPPFQPMTDENTHVPTATYLAFLSCILHFQKVRPADLKVSVGGWVLAAPVRLGTKVLVAGCTTSSTFGGCGPPMKGVGGVPLYK